MYVGVAVGRPTTEGRGAGRTHRRRHRSRRRRRQHVRRGAAIAPRGPPIRPEAAEEGAAEPEARTRTHAEVGRRTRERARTGSGGASSGGACAQGTANWPAALEALTRRLRTRKQEAVDDIDTERADQRNSASVALMLHDFGPRARLGRGVRAGGRCFRCRRPSGRQSWSRSRRSPRCRPVLMYGVVRSCLRHFVAPGAREEVAAQKSQ
jgi:hypothetical protein